MLAEVFLHPFGEIERELVEAVRTAIAQSFNVKATLAPVLAVPAKAYSTARRQYSSTALLDELARLPRADKQTRLGIATVDLYVPDLNFIFGEASGVRRIAVFSLARLDPRYFGEPANQALLVQRATTEAVHELGHVFGLGHCPRTDCVMWFSNTLAETDRKGSSFCERCARLLSKSV
jgi:archaemetzincin